MICRWCGAPLGEWFDRPCVAGRVHDAEVECPVCGGDWGEKPEVCQSCGATVVQVSEAVANLTRM